MRDAGNYLKSYDMEKMKVSLKEEGGAFTVFGGEALLTPIDDLEKIFSWGLEWYGYNTVQTNGALISDDHIELFKKYKVHVGISVDGPGELNMSRWAGSVEKTIDMTRRSLGAIDRLISHGIIPSIIITLYRGNATEEHIPTLISWIRELDSKGINYMRIHLLEVDHEDVQNSYSLTPQQNVDALLELDKVEQTLSNIKFDIFTDMRNMLLGKDDSATCIWRACDPYTTTAVRGVDGQGVKSNCGRTNKDGVAFTKSDTSGHERQVALYNVPQEYNGCQGCRFFMMCSGNCPGTAVNGDWRNRTEHCSVWMTLLEVEEQKLVKEGQSPVSLSSDREKLENIMLDYWKKGESITISTAMNILKNPSENNISSVKARPHGDAPHGDAPHGDIQHGDHTDVSKLQKK